MSKIKIALSFIGIIVALIIIVPNIGNLLFKRNVKREVEAIFAKVESKSDIIRLEEIKELPYNVQRWLEYSGVVGQEKIVSVRGKQKAEMRLGNDKPWMKVEADQYFTIDEPGFIWYANIKMAPLLHISGRDLYSDGKGNMLIKILSLFTVADSKGAEMDQGTMLRYLAEMMWYPSAALMNYITWEEIDSNHANATMTYGDVTASGIFTFNDIGEIVNFEAQRYGEFEGKFSMETWSIDVNEYKEFGGIMVPTIGSVIWKLKDGDYNWYKFELTEIEYNVPELY